MAEKTGISWTDHTFNVAWGCAKVSPGCQSCYAETLAVRYGHGAWGPKAARRVFGDKHWAEPLKWNRQAEREGRRHRVFCSSMCDVLEDHPDVIGELAKLWPLIRRTPWLDWQLLTKRAERIAESLPADWGEGYANVWLGVSVENQEYAYERLERLLHVPARVKFASYEPALGGIDWTCTVFGTRLIEIVDWIIYGGESGPKFRPDNDDWSRATRVACCANGVAFFRKQAAGRRPGTGVELDGEVVQEFPPPDRGAVVIDS